MGGPVGISELLTALARGRSADFKSAVSQRFQPACLDCGSPAELLSLKSVIGRLEMCATTSADGLTWLGDMPQDSGVPPLKAIAAMSLNRVIGANSKIPWHLPDDFKWFKRMTTDHILVMGRKTFESIGKPLPNRTTIVLSRSPLQVPGVQKISELEELAKLPLEGREIFICGGAQIYEQALPLCSDLYLTLVKRVVEGDTFFPLFEEQFHLASEIEDRPEFKILHYQRNTEKKSRNAFEVPA